MDDATLIALLLDRVPRADLLALALRHASPCPQCGRQVRSARTHPLCSRCWKRTPAGRADNRLRMARLRARSRDQQDVLLDLLLRWQGLAAASVVA
jgi:hypothetical protein